MRTSLWPGMLKTLMANESRQQRACVCSKSATLFRATGVDSSDRGRSVGRLAAGELGHGSRDVDFFDLKADVEALLALRAASRGFRLTPRTSGASSGAVRHVWRGDRARMAGRLHPEHGARMDLTYPVFLFELERQQHWQASSPNIGNSSYPAIRRDIAVIVDEGWLPTPCLRTVRESGGDLLKGTDVFLSITGDRLIKEEKHCLRFEIAG